MRLHDVPARTTLTLDDDVAASLQIEARRRGVPFRTVVNEAIRAGLAGPRPTATRFAIEARSMGLRPGIDLDDIEGVLDVLDGAQRR